MGTNEIHDDGKRFEVSAVDSVHRLHVRWPSETTRMAASSSTTDGGEPVASASPHATNDRDRSESVDESTSGPGVPADRSARNAWLLVVPFAATMLGVAVGLVFGFGVFDPGTPGDVSLLPYVVLVPYFLAGLAGTHWLVRDAIRLAATDADWQPNPWLYVLSGALVLETVVAVPVIRGEVTTGVVPYLAGGFVLAGVLSSVVAGPVYLLVRRRKLGTP